MTPYPPTIGKEFAALYARETGRTLTPEQAQQYAERLLGFVQIVCDIHSAPPPKPP